MQRYNQQKSSRRSPPTISLIREDLNSTQGIISYYLSKLGWKTPKIACYLGISPQTVTKRYQQFVNGEFNISPGEEEEVVQILHYSIQGFDMKDTPKMQSGDDMIKRSRTNRRSRSPSQGKPVYMTTASGANYVQSPQSQSNRYRERNIPVQASINPRDQRAFYDSTKRLTDIQDPNFEDYDPNY